MATLPTSLALISITDGAEAVASDLRNDYSDIQTAVNSLITILAGGTSGDVFRSSGGTTVAWAAGSGGSGTTYRKSTTKTVNTTVAATDLLNGEITIGASVIGATGVAKLSASGDLLNNNVTAGNPRFQLVLGGTTLFDTGAGSATAWTTGAARAAWGLEATIRNSAENAQTVDFHLWTSIAVNTAATTAVTTGTGAYATNATLGGDARGVNSGLAVDTTASKLLALNIILPANNANVECKLFGALVEVT